MILELFQIYSLCFFVFKSVHYISGEFGHINVQDKYTLVCQLNRNGNSTWKKAGFWGPQHLLFLSVLFKVKFVGHGQTQFLVWENIYMLSYCINQQDDNLWYLFRITVVILIHQCIWEHYFARTDNGHPLVYTFTFTDLFSFWWIYWLYSWYNKPENDNLMSSYWLCIIKKCLLIVHPNWHLKWNVNVTKKCKAIFSP